MEPAVTCSKLRLWLVLMLALPAVGCSGQTLRAVPTYSPSTPTLVTGRVIELKKQGAWIDFDNAFVSYDSVVVELLSPADAIGARVYLQYQVEPNASGLIIQPGLVLRFTLPVVPSSSCCEPYLNEVADLRQVLDH